MEEAENVCLAKVPSTLVQNLEPIQDFSRLQNTFRVHRPNPLFQVNNRVRSHGMIIPIVLELAIPIRQL